MEKVESQKHQELVSELVDLFKERGYRIDAVADGNGESPRVVENGNGVGDGENKVPDIDAYKEEDKRYIRGEAKTGDGDIETEHSITQYLLFSNIQCNGKSSWLYIMVPEAAKEKLEDVLEENVPERQRKRIFVRIFRE